MAKRQGTRKVNKELLGRIAMAAALWYRAFSPKPYILYVSSDVHGPERTPDAQVVQFMVIDLFGISKDYLILRQRSNCTLMEVREIQVLSRMYGLSHLVALTHQYHARRAQRYFDEVLSNVSVIPVRKGILADMTLPSERPGLLAEVQVIIEDSQPGGWNVTREYLIEWLLNEVHTLDQRGRVERWLANMLRPVA
jgi:hypothetical protein